MAREDFSRRGLNRLGRNSHSPSAAPRALSSPIVVACVCIALALTAASLEAQPNFLGVASNNNVGSSLTISVPAGVANGDLLVAVVGVSVNPSTSFPGGWTAVDPGLAGFNGATCPTDGDPTGIPCQLSVYYKISDGTDTSVTVTFGTTRHSAGAVLRYSGAHQTMPIGPVATDSGSNNDADPPVAPAITTTEANTLVLRAAVADADPGAGGDTQTPLLGGPATQRFALQSNTPQTIAATIMTAASDALQAAAGNSGTASFTGGAGNWATATVGIRPAGAVIEADLSISKNDGETKVNPGTQITYTIVAANSVGSADTVTGASVDDMFPSSLTCNWTCAGSGGGSCTAGGSGNIADSVTLPPGAAATYSAVCDIDTGASGNISNLATITAPAGVNDSDGGNNQATDNTAINQAPIALCMDVLEDADASCQAAASVDNGSNDPDGDNPISISEDPAGPYGLGDTSVELTVTDSLGLSDMCTATVTVQDVTNPVISCNSSPTIVPPDPPISFTATADDNCSVGSVAISAFSCFAVKKNGKVIDKSNSCKVSIDGDTITISHSGGVGTTIAWSVAATDGSGNESMADCFVQVVIPGQNK